MNPFNMDDKSILYNISLGAAVAEEVQEDVLKVEPEEHMEKADLIKRDQRWPSNERFI